MTYYRFFILVFICLLLSVTTSAQPKHTFIFDRPFKMHHAGHCKILSVIDERPDKNYIGYVRTGDMNIHEVLVTEFPFNYALEACYRSIDLNSPSDDELLLVLYAWEVEDRPDMGEIGSLYFFGDFYKGKEDRYTYVGTIDSLFEVATGIDITDTLLRMAIEQTAEVFVKYSAATASTNLYFTREQISAKQAISKKIFPIYNTTEFKVGVYYTVEQFLNNTPVDTPIKRETFITNSGAIRDYRTYFLNAKGRKQDFLKPDTYFAAYDGKGWSISLDGKNCLMKYERGEFLAYRLLPGPVNKQARASGGAIVGGAMGGAIVGGFGGVRGGGGKSAKPSAIKYMVKFVPAKKDFIKVKRL